MSSDDCCDAVDCERVSNATWYALLQDGTLVDASHLVQTEIIRRQFGHALTEALLAVKQSSLKSYEFRDVGEPGSTNSQPPNTSALRAIYRVAKCSAKVHLCRKRHLCIIADTL